MREIGRLVVLAATGALIIWAAGQPASSQSRAPENAGPVQADNSRDCSYDRDGEPAPALATNSSSDIAIKYQEPGDYKRCKEYLQNKRILDAPRGFLAQLRLPYPFELVARVCNAQEVKGLAFYNPSERNITLCYQAVRFIFENAPKPDQPENVTIGSDVIPDIGHDEFIFGALIGALLHESGHAVFHMMTVPVFGREEDAADQFASLLLLAAFAAQDQKGLHDLTRQVIRSFAYFWYMSSKASPARYYSDPHSTPIQRFYNIACLAYGADPREFEEFAKFVANRNCKAEFGQVKAAGLKTILPYLAGN